MSRARLLTLALALALAVALAPLAAACGTSGERGVTAPAEVEGRIVEVRGEGDAVRSFVVDGAGGRHELTIDPAVDYGFDLAHLHEHHATGDPVVCRVEERDGVLYALDIRDA